VGAVKERARLPAVLTAPTRRRRRPAEVLDVPSVAVGLDEAVVDCALYCGGHRKGGRIPLSDAMESAQDDEGFVWIGLHEPDEAALAVVAEEFGLHPLAVEDAVHAHQRPKLETYGDTVFLVLKTVRYVDHEEVVETGELMLFLGEDFVVTVRHGEAAGLGDVRRELEARPDLLAVGPSVVLWAVADRVVDGYAPAISSLETDIDEIELQVFSGGRLGDPTERIYKLKREVLDFKRAVRPLVEATERLAGGSHRLVHESVQPYFRDVHDHVVRAAEQVEAMDDLLTGALQSNLAQVSMRQNGDMRKISAWVAIAGGNTLVAGVYGMNFEHMPELGWLYGYPFALGLMLVLSLALYRGFKRNEWL
jgi:magnesium transporter